MSNFRESRFGVCTPTPFDLEKVVMAIMLGRPPGGMIAARSATPERQRR